MNKVVALLVLVAFTFSTSDAYKSCCRQKIDYGTCYQSVTRYAYNISCGKCVPFTYSGCGGDENNFSCLDDCQSSCTGCGPCPKYSLPKPPPGCEYKWSDGPDGCPRPRLSCNCPKLYCAPDACRIGERCLPAPSASCNSCPCPQYQCVTDPCYAVSSQLQPCEKCVSVPAPSCTSSPCPLVAYRENNCAPPAPAPPQCPVYVRCPPTGNPCQSASCPAYPSAKCVVDPCDCRKYTWIDYGNTYSSNDCYYGRKR